MVDVIVFQVITQQDHLRIVILVMFLVELAMEEDQIIVQAVLEIIVLLIPATTDVIVI